MARPFKETKLGKAFTQTESLDYTELKEQYKILQKGANDRLYELEQVAKKNNPYYQGLLNFAYADAIEDIEAQTGTQTTRFKKASKDYDELLAQVKDIKHFLSQRTSTITGIRSVQKASNTMNEKYGLDITWQEMEKYFASGLADKMDKKYGSKTALQTIGKIQTGGKKLIADIRKKVRQHETISQDESYILKMAKENNVTLKELMKK